MTFFSQRNGFDQSENWLNCASEKLKNRILSRFYKQEFVYGSSIIYPEHYTTGVEEMMIEMGIPYDYPADRIVKERNYRILANEVIKGEWFVIYDFIEKYLKLCDEEKRGKMKNDFNQILEDEVSAYRIIDDQIIPITNETELETINIAKQTKFDPVNMHISKALELYSDRRKPDYENSIKESISAVESMCCIITGQSGANATLGNAIKKLKDKGVHIHSSLEKAFSSAYGYTSDENGIRHGGIDFTNAPPEDAKYMLVSCSAFVNYLIEKWAKSS